MKAIQAYKQADDAVSPVIGVILMVAITVVLAAVVFVLVTKLAGNQKDQAPTLSFSRKDDTTGVTQNRLTIVSINGGTIMSQDIIFKNSAGATAGGPATINAAPASGFCSVRVATATALSAGDVITCNGDGPFTVIHQPSGSVMYTASFHT